MPRFPAFGIAVDRKPVFARDDILPHDRWSEFEEEPTRLDATITDVNIGGSDPTIQVRAADGVNWTIELAPHSRNREAGLTAAMALPGDRVSVVGRRTHHFGENRVKALHLTIADREFVLYPDCLAES
ncbi:hypothetical protein [Paracoccus spongiarum]|uniref:Uncharacterized protein n=1 Tax=Paracoccus spongiarum TaxID=3064387 RepID=A0ABT9JGC2_9RHOB|nr:hypothetical protein [Paracoccus sp. 2205BS29-5]MDP5308834.1 hypothetical protein [Paracoccus sp. 2205BS29-5]